MTSHSFQTQRLPSFVGRLPIGRPSNAARVSRCDDRHRVRLQQQRAPSPSDPGTRHPSSRSRSGVPVAAVVRLLRSTSALPHVTRRVAPPAVRRTTPRRDRGPRFTTSSRSSPASGVNSAARRLRRRAPRRRPRRAPAARSAAIVAPQREQVARAAADARRVRLALVPVELAALERCRGRAGSGRRPALSGVARLGKLREELSAPLLHRLAPARGLWSAK